MFIELITNPNFVSAFSFILSFSVFYYTYLKLPNIKLYIGQTINLWHLNNNLGIDLQLLYINTSFSDVKTFLIMRYFSYLRSI